jgi:hypothetical protein
VAFDPLKRVEEDQAGGLPSSRNISNRNIAMGTRKNYTRVSSYKPGAFGHYAHDGDEKTAWLPEPGQNEAFLEISWGLSETVDRVDIHEKGGTEMPRLSLELYDGSLWKPIAHAEGLPRNHFLFPPRSASALRIRLAANGTGGGIAEVEVYNTQSSNPLPRHGSDDLVAAMKSANAVILFEGSPYAYSRLGRTLIKARTPEASLAEIWTKPVMEFICTSLGGKAEVTGDETLQLTLNAHTTALNAVPESRILARIKAMAEGAGLGFRQRGPLVLVGAGLEALDNDKVISELSGLLGRNPSLTSGPEESGSKPRSHLNPDSEVASQNKPAAVIAPTMTREGLTYEWAGFRSMADPDTNADAWLKYSEVKAARTWVSSTRVMNSYVRPEKQIQSTEDFEALKREIRAAPEKNSSIAMRAFLEKHHRQLAAEFGIYNTLGISLINETGPKDWPDTLQADFTNWAGCYALSYYLAKNYGVAAHQYGNEPDWFFNQSTDKQIARRLTLIADAVHCAVEDVNRDHDRNLKAVFSAPVLAGDFQGRTARIMMQNLYRRYDGGSSPTPLFQMFNRHRYGDRPHQNATEVRQAKQMMVEEAGEVLPQVFTELNYSTGRHWGLPTTTFLNDSPAVFTSIASIWGWMMQEQGVHGIFVFKLNDPGVWSWKGTGPFSNVITYSMYPEQDPGAEPKKKEQISYGSKNFEVCRLFSRGFHGSRPLLKTEIACSDPEYRSWTTLDEQTGRYYVWAVQVDEFATYELEFDLNRLDLPPDALITAETVSGARQGEVTLVTALPQDRKIRLQQPPQSALLLTIHQRPLKRQTVYPHADATLIQGGQSERNFGKETTLQIGRDTKSGSNKISFLKFKLPVGTAEVQRAVLELHGQSHSAHAYDGGLLFRVYAVQEAEWDESGITAANAPSVCRTVSALKKIDLHHHPVGHVTCFAAPAKLRVDVTQLVREARKNSREEVDLVLIKEVHWPGENTDHISAVISSREAGQQEAPKLYLWE